MADRPKKRATSAPAEESFVLRKRPPPTLQEASERLTAAHWNAVEDLNDMVRCAKMLAPRDRESQEALERAYTVGLECLGALLGVVGVDPRIRDMWIVLEGGRRGDQDAIKFRQIAELLEFAARIPEDPIWSGPRDPVGVVGVVRDGLHSVHEGFDAIKSARLAEIVNGSGATSGKVADLLIEARVFGASPPRTKYESERKAHRTRIQQKVDKALKRRRQR